MCGIAGVYVYREGAPPVDPEELLRIRDHMIKRGPDGAGLWVDAAHRIGLAHRRLAIIDLSESGVQPMATADGRFNITFNGEIYNYRELRAELQRDGIVFRSESDTEVLLHLYRRHGPEMLTKLRGMYAFGIWDAVDRSLFLARDSFGIKPLYYSDDGKAIRFASQVKALIAGGRIRQTIDPVAQVSFYVWGAVPEPFTIYADILPLPAGSWLKFQPGRPSTPVQHYCIADAFARAEAAPRGKAGRDDHLHAILDALRDSVRAHMVADVPVGLFLSAGIDSNLLAGYARDATPEKIKAITLAFSEYAGTPFDESPVAVLAARGLSLDHTVRYVERAEFHDEVDRLFAAMDQPTTDGVNSYFVSKVAAEAGIKVALSGLGGDELLAGYPSFSQVPTVVRYVGALPGPVRALGPLLRRMIAPLLPTRYISPKYAGMLEHGGDWSGAYLLRRALHMPWEVPGALSSAEVHLAWGRIVEAQRDDREKLARIDNPQLKVSYLELRNYLCNQLVRDTDWAGMAHSLEIRTPFLDVPLMECLAGAVAAVPDVTKRTLARIPAAGIPDAILNRSKSGFAIPVRDWLMARGRGLRGWSQRVATEWQFPSVRVVALCTDAYGGIGGIAKFNRDLLNSLAEESQCVAVEVLPRLVKLDPGHLPTKITFHSEAATGKTAYICTLARLLLRGKGADWLICGHINLVPLGWLASRLMGCPMTLIVHGIDAWTPHRNFLVRILLKRVDFVVAVSEFTIEKMRAWSNIARERFEVLPNCVELDKFFPRPRDADLVNRYHLEDKTVLMTVGRLASRERFKGFDEVMDAMPSLLRRNPQMHYMVVGDGDDAERLKQKTRDQGIEKHVTFTGYIDEAEKAAHYSVADAYVMPSRGEGFGIVFLEALASGVPVLGSKADGSRDALLGGRLGILVDPNNPAEVEQGIVTVLARPKGEVPQDLAGFSYDAFRLRVHDRLLSKLTGTGI